MQNDRYCCISINNKLRGYFPNILFHMKKCKNKLSNWISS